jgi:hypothetical protein
LFDVAQGCPAAHNTERSHIYFPPILEIQASEDTYSPTHLLGLDRPVQFEHITRELVLPFRSGDFNSLPKLQCLCPQMEGRARCPGSAGDCCDTQPSLGELDQPIANGKVVVIGRPRRRRSRFEPFARIRCAEHGLR